MINIIQTEKASKPKGPYAQAIATDAKKMIYTAGLLGINPETGKFLEGIKNQTHQTIKNLQAVLEAANSDLYHVLKITLYVSPSCMNDFTLINTIYEQYFVNHKPARTRVVTELPGKGLVEIDAIAVSKE